MRLRHSCRHTALPLTDFSPILTQALTEIIFESHWIPTESYPTSVQTEETGLIPVRHICLMRKCIRNAGLSSAPMPGWMVSERCLFASTQPYRVGRGGTSLLSLLYSLKNFTIHKSRDNFYTILYILQTSLNSQFLSSKYAILYFCLISSDFIIIFVQKFIMSYYEAKRYNEATSENTIPDTTGSRRNGAGRTCHNQGY